MSKIFKSKIDIGLIIFLIFIYSIVGFYIFNNPIDIDYYAITTVIFSLIFIIYIFLSIRYVISNNQLSVKVGFLMNKKINISAIKKIKETNNIISSPAASLDRLEIFYNKFDSVIISPKNKNEFINVLLSINPNIEITFK